MKNTNEILEQMFEKTSYGVCELWDVLWYKNINIQSIRKISSWYINDCHGRIKAKIITHTKGHLITIKTSLNHSVYKSPTVKQ